jgi:hypothetical protein
MKEIIKMVIFAGPIILGIYCIIGFFIGFIEATICLGAAILIAALINWWFLFAWDIIEKYIE